MRFTYDVQSTDILARVRNGRLVDGFNDKNMVRVFFCQSGKCGFPPASQGATKKSSNPSQSV